MFSLIVPRKGKPLHTNVSAGASQAVQLVAANRERKTAVFQNTGAETVYIGASTVSNVGANRGYALFAGVTFVDNATDTDWWAISTSTTNVIHVIEVS